MAQRVTVQLVDDLDGSAAEETVPFALDGVSYKIDLNGKHAKKLRSVFSVYLQHGRRTGGRRRAVALNATRAGTRTISERERSHAVRVWARKQKIHVADRGRIPSAVMARFLAVHPDWDVV